MEKTKKYLILIIFALLTCFCFWVVNLDMNKTEIDNLKDYRKINIQKKVTAVVSESEEIFQVNNFTFEQLRPTLDVGMFEHDNITKFNEVINNKKNDSILALIEWEYDFMVLKCNNKFVRLKKNEQFWENDNCRVTIDLKKERMMTELPIEGKVELKGFLIIEMDNKKLKKEFIGIE